MKNNTINVLQFICSTGFYGAERWVLALAKHLKSDVINCELAVTCEAENQNLELVKHYKKLDLPTVEIPMSGRFDFSAINKLAEYCKNNRIDIIHTHGYKSDIIGVLAARKAGIPIVVTPHGFENASDLKLRTFIWLGNQSLKFADVVAPLSPQLCIDVKNIGVKDDKVHYVQNGVDLSEVEETPAPEKGAKKRVGFIGQMISRKNIRDILDLFEQLHDEHENVELVLLGDGDAREELETYSKTLKSVEDIHFLGFRDDRITLLKSFDIFVMTSTLEGIPRCLMEACAASIPVAAYDIPGIDQLINHDQSGLLATLHDKDTLYGYWQKILFEQDCADQIASKAKEHVYEAYSAQRMAREYTELFQKMVSK